MISHYAIRNLHCGGCAARIEEALTRLPGVLHAAIDLGAQRLRLEGEAVSLEDINRIADGIEPGVVVEEYVAVQSDCQAETPEDDARHAVPRMIASAVLLTCGLLFDTRLEAVFPAWLVRTTLYGIPYLLCGYGVLYKGWLSLRKGDFFNEFTLMGGATLAAVALGELSEAVGVMLFYCLGEYVQERAAGNSRRSIRALLAARPTVAHLLEGDAVRDATPETLRPGMHILVKPGEKIPLDGTVLSGSSQVDTSPLTGESTPVRAEAGRAVFAGTINLDGTLVVEVTSLYENSSVARILEMVESATARKAPTERFITRFARYYTPAVVAAAAVVALLPPLFGAGAFHDWLYRALVLLVISCPCALVISIPLGYFGGIGAASRRGILVKGGNVLDALRAVRIVAFDKTGTLTEGVFAVTRVLPAPGVSESEVVRQAALAESHSNHPIARSILQAARQMEKNATLPAADAASTEQGAPLSGTGKHDDSADFAAGMETREISGKGLLAEHGETRLLVGNRALMEQFGITAAPVDEPGTVVHVARDAAYLGALVVSDVLRAASAPTVRALRDMGVRKVAMLTGDRPEGAAAIARQLDLDVVRAGLLPEDKAAALESLGPKEETLFVGDGINDAPVLASAGVGVAMGGLGSEAAIEIADAVILDDSPARLVDLLAVAARTRAIVWQNIVMALSIKGVFMALGVVGLSGLWEAVFADVGVALLAVLNAGRAGRVAA